MASLVGWVLVFRGIFWYKRFMQQAVSTAARASVAVVALAIVGCAASTVTQQPILSPPPQLSADGWRPIQTVVIDAGHGGHDPGAVHDGLREKDLALEIAQFLRQELAGRGLSIAMTRDRDEFLSLSQRPAIANRLQADLFISVHINANRQSHVAGLEVYYPRHSVVTASASWPPHVREEDVAFPSVTIRQVLWDLALSQARQESSRLANDVCASMASRLEVPCRWVKPARFVVLREATMPAILVEVGYVSNHEEAARLREPSYRRDIATGIADGVLAYIRSRGLQHS